MFGQKTSLKLVFNLKKSVPNDKWQRDSQFVWLETKKNWLKIAENIMLLP